STCADSSAIWSPSRSSSWTCSGGVKRTGEWMSMTVSLEATLHPAFGATWERCTTAIPGRAMMFAVVAPGRPPREPARAAGTTSRDSRRHAPSPLRRSCQGENAAHTKSGHDHSPRAHLCSGWRGATWRAKRPVQSAIAFRAPHDLGDAGDLPPAEPSLQDVRVAAVAVEESRVRGVGGPAADREVAAADRCVAGDLHEVTRA